MAIETQLDRMDREEASLRRLFSSLEIPPHTAFPYMLNPWGNSFQARCRCGWKGERFRSPIAHVARTFADIEARSHNSQNGHNR